MLLRYIFQIIGSLVFMFTLSPKLTGVLISVVPIVGIGAQQYGLYSGFSFYLHMYPCICSMDCLNKEIKKESSSSPLVTPVGTITTPSLNLVTLSILHHHFGYIPAHTQRRINTSLCAVASWLVRSSPVRVRALAGDIMLCSWARD